MYDCVYFSTRFFRSIAMIFYLLLAVFALWIIVFRFRRRRLYRLASLIPGPKELPIIGIAHTVRGNTEDIMRSMQRFAYESMQHNGIIRFWLGHIFYVMLVNPVDLEVVFKTCLEKDDAYRYIRKLTGNGSAFAPVSIWRQRRKINIAALSPKIVESFIDVFSMQSEIMTKILMDRVGNGQFPIWPYLNRYALDSVGETTMGVNINSQGSLNAPFLEAVNCLLNVIAERMFHLWLQPEWMFRLFPQYALYSKSKEFVYDYMDKVLKNKREELRNRKKCETDAVQSCDLKDYQNKSLLDHLISVSGGDKGYSDLELREEIFVMVVAGTDTSAVCMGYTLLLLGKYPLIQDKVYEELREVFGDSERPLVKEDLGKLKYLERVIKESLRLFPSVPFITRTILVDTKLPSGRILPAGSGAILSIWGAHRDPKYWGPDAEAFDPDRFLPERFKLQHACSYIPFSNMPRNCIGYRYAMLSIKTALSSILRRYRVVAAPEPSAAPRIRVKMDIMMKAVDDYTLALEMRQPRNIM
ncbi:cytochrome P450 4C1-like [Epargyreus clarus]|uniref:cytochrome P450 4C1-like n=1 Tax=Epargyreus clarus TaxID=520877 RepID=UPI003C309EA6